MNKSTKGNAQMTTDVTKKESKLPTIRELVEGKAFKEQIVKALPKHLTPDRFIRISLTALTRTPKLTQCTQASLFKCLLDLSQLGIEPDGRRAHLIPFENRKEGTVECQLIIDYKGLVELVMRAGLVSNLHADVICENDVFEYDRGAITAHKIDFRKPRGNVYAAYSICRFKDGTEKAEVMTKDEIEGIRKRSRAGQSGPWCTDWNEMAKKTVFRRLSKWLTLSPEYRDALDKDDDRVDDIPTGQWLPPETRTPIFRASEAAVPTQQDNPPANDQPTAAQESMPPEPVGASPDAGPAKPPTEDTEGPKASLLRAFTQDFGGTEGQLISVLRADGLIKQHETLADITNAKASALLKNIKALYDRVGEQKKK